MPMISLVVWDGRQPWPMLVDQSKIVQVVPASTDGLDVSRPALSAELRRRGSTDISIVSFDHRPDLLALGSAANIIRAMNAP